MNTSGSSAIATHWPSAWRKRSGSWLKVGGLYDSKMPSDMPAAKVSTGPPNRTSTRGLFFSAITRASASPEEKRTKLLAVDGELVHHRLEAVGGGREAALFLIQCAHAELAVGQHFLNVAQLLLRQGSELAVGELGHELLAFLLGAEGVHGVAVGLVHLLVVDVADLFLGFGGLFHGGIEQDEVLILGFGLRQSVTAAFAEPGVGDGQLGLGQIFAGVVGVDEVLQQQARDFETGVLDIVDGLVKQHLIGLLGVFGDGVGVLFAANATAAQEYRNRQDHSGRTNRVSNHNHSITLNWTLAAALSTRHLANGT